MCVRERDVILMTFQLLYQWSRLHTPKRASEVILHLVGEVEVVIMVGAGSGMNCDGLKNMKCFFI